MGRALNPPESTVIPSLPALPHLHAASLRTPPAQRNLQLPPRSPSGPLASCRSQTQPPFGSDQGRGDALRARPSSRGQNGHTLHPFFTRRPLSPPPPRPPAVSFCPRAFGPSHPCGWVATCFPSGDFRLARRPRGPSTRPFRGGTVTLPVPAARLLGPSAHRWPLGRPPRRAPVGEAALAWACMCLPETCFPSLGAANPGGAGGPRAALCA